MRIAKTEIEKYSTEQAEELLWRWPIWARPEQLPPEGDWFVWLILAGRGFGKTRSGAEWIIDQHQFRGRKTTGIVAATAADLRDYCIEGEAGVLTVAPPWFVPSYQPSKRRLVWPNGTVTSLFSAAEPERLRGPNLEAVWADEIAAWQYLDKAMDNLEFTLRAGEDPRAVFTTTPKPKKRLREILNDPGTVRTGGPMSDNRANLAGPWFERMVRKYAGTRTGRQELEAELLDQAEGALWQRAWFDAHRRADLPCRPQRVAVAVDPPASKTEDSAEAGIVIGAKGDDGRGYVLADRSRQASPDEWARTAITAYFEFEANHIVVERNNGGEMVETTILLTAKAMKLENLIPTDVIPVVTVWASHGKQARAEPVSALYEQGRISHVTPPPGGTDPDYKPEREFNALEDQCCGWEPNSGDKSPDRLDALVWLFTDLMLGDDVVNVAAGGGTAKSYWKG